MHPGRTAGAERGGDSDSMQMFRMGVEGGKPARGQDRRAAGMVLQGRRQHHRAAGRAARRCPRSRSRAARKPRSSACTSSTTAARRAGSASCSATSSPTTATEEQNYLYAAHSKLRECSMGPELLVGDLPDSVRGLSRVLRDGETLWKGDFQSGEDHMSHSIANLEHHHFKYAMFRRPGFVHCHFFGAAVLSYAAGVRARARRRVQARRAGVRPAAAQHAAPRRARNLHGRSACRLGALPWHGGLPRCRVPAACWIRRFSDDGDRLCARSDRLPPQGPIVVWCALVGLLLAQRIGVRPTPQTDRCRRGTTARRRRRSSNSCRRPRRRAARSSCRRPSASPPSTRTVRSGSSIRVLAGDVLPRARAGASSRRSRSWPRSSRSRRCCRATGRQSRSCRGPTSIKMLAATLDRHVGRDIPGRGEEVARGGQGPALEEAVQGAHLPADAGSAEVPARQRLQDVHRHRRRAGLRARVRRGVYGIPPEQVVGTAGGTTYGYGKDGKPC